MKVYLSGKITGDSNYRQKFSSMEKELLSYGYVVFNPAVLPDGFEYEDYMDLDLLILSRCDAIFLMRDWRNSPGAKREYEEAKRLGLRILTEADLKIRRTLLQLCRDSKRLAEIEQDDDANKTWAEKIIQLSDNVEKKIRCFIPHLSEEENLLQVYEDFEPELKRFFIEEFISDSDKQIEYDMIERLSGAEFDEKIKLAQMYSTTAELVEMFKGKIDKAA
jgi:hypothetical protein